MVTGGAWIRWRYWRPVFNKMARSGVGSGSGFWAMLVEIQANEDGFKRLTETSNWGLNEEGSPRRRWTLAMCHRRDVSYGRCAII